MARFEDPSRLWMAAERSIVRSSGNQDTEPGSPKFDYTINLIRALGIQQERAVSAIPLLKTIQKSLQTQTPPPAQNSNARSGGRSTMRFLPTILTPLVDQALAAIDGTDPDAVQKLKTATSARNLLNRARNGAQSPGGRGGGFGNPVNRTGSPTRPSRSGGR